MNSENKTKKMSLEERIDLHRRMAESYHSAYAKKAVKDGATYVEWKFAKDALYQSLYFTGDNVIKLDSSLSISVEKSATMEAKAYSVTFPDWGPVDFKCWPADNGFTMRTRFQGHMKDGTRMSFSSIGMVETNDQGEITHWETFVNGDEYGPFLQAAIGVRGPFLKGGSEYMEAVARVLKENGLSL